MFYCSSFQKHYSADLSHSLFRRAAALPVLSRPARPPPHPRARPAARKARGALGAPALSPARPGPASPAAPRPPGRRRCSRFPAGRQRAQQRRAGSAGRLPKGDAAAAGRGEAGPREPLTHILVEGVGGEKRHGGAGGAGRPPLPAARRRRDREQPSAAAAAAPPPGPGSSAATPSQAERRLPRSTPGTGAGPAAGPSGPDRPEPRFMFFSYMESFRPPVRDSFVPRDVCFLCKIFGASL